MALQLELYRSASRYLTQRALSGRVPGVVTSPVAPLRLAKRVWFQPVSFHSPRQPKWAKSSTVRLR